jgi:orotate phosphoribosyltransferase
MDRDELAARLKEAAYLEGDFILRSGRRSNYYFDKYLFETRPDLLRDVARELADILPADVDRLAGAALGGVPLAAAVALQTGLPYVIVRKESKEYGTEQRLEGLLEDGDRVALVEDVVTTGGAALSAAQALLDAGAAEVLAFVVLDRQEGGEKAFREAGVPFRALFTSRSMGLKGD